jgi:hypothetical protein
MRGNAACPVWGGHGGNRRHKDARRLRSTPYLVTENRILRNQITDRVRLTDGERKTLADIGQKLGKQALKDVAKIVQPDTMLG